MKPINFIRVILLLIMVTLPIKVSQAQLFSPSVKLSSGFVFLPSGENNFLNHKFERGKFTTLDLEYTYYRDAHVYYNAYFYGFTTGLKYQKTTNTIINNYNQKSSSEEIESIIIPLLLANKRNAWNNNFRFGFLGIYDFKRKADDKFIWNTRPYHIDIYFSFGFDNQILRYRTDGWMWTIEMTGQYSLTDHIYRGNNPNHVKLLKIGGKIGIIYEFDYYHYRGWINNY